MCIPIYVVSANSNDETEFIPMDRRTQENGDSRDLIAASIPFLVIQRKKLYR